MAKTYHGDAPITATTSIVHVKDSKLAAALITVGVPLRKDPPYTHVLLKNGHEEFTYNFHLSTPDGEFLTRDLVKAWSEDVAFLASNPRHPFAYAMLAVKNYAQILAHQHIDRPFVAFNATDEESGEPCTLLVQKDTRKHKAAIEAGFTQI